MKLTLVEEWRSAWRWISVNCMVAAGALQGAWLFIPEDMKATVPPGVLQWVTGALMVVGFIGRLVKQPESAK